MKLTYYRGTPPNFGDELNTFVWPKLLPEGFLDDDEDSLFLGIGSILWDYLPSKPQKYVLGSGYGGYSGLPNLHDGSWTPIFVRGPRTAASLGLSPDLAICDSAVLLRTIPSVLATRPRRGTGFMPHYDSLGRGDWRRVCERAGINFVDPSQPVDQILEAIGSLEMLITEAMHGAIVADSLRTPWIALQPIHPGHRMKWLDWADSLGLRLRSHSLWPSSVLEMVVQLTRGSRYYDGRAAKLAGNAMLTPFNASLSQIAELRLGAIARSTPQLSNDRAIDDVTNRASMALDRFVTRHC